MIVLLVSQRIGKRADARLEDTIKIINSSSADLILFSGNTLLFKNDLAYLERSLQNKKSAVLFETKEGGNHLYRIEGGKIFDMKTTQVFATSEQIRQNPSLAEELINELEQRRCFSVCGKHCLILQCGELNILKNYQKEGNRVAFRVDNDPILEKRFSDLLGQTDIVLNPIHSPMGNQPKLLKRRVFLSCNGRAYFSTSNAVDSKHLGLEYKSLQYALLDGAVLSELKNEEFRSSYITRTFEI